MTTPLSTPRGIAALTAAAASFVACDTCMKLAMADLPPFQVLAMRGTAATLWTLPILLWLGLGSQAARAFNRWVLLRAASETVAVLMFVLCLKRMPIGDLTALMQTAPLIILLAGALFWRDHIGVWGFGLISLGFLGALLVAQPGGASASAIAPLALLAAALAAGRDILSRKVPPDVPAMIAAFTTIVMVMAAAWIAAGSFETWTPPSSRHLVLLAAAGLLLLGGQFFVFLAFRLAKAAVVAPFLYTFTFWAMLSGLFVFGDRPNALSLAGVALIVASGLAVVLLDGRRRAAAAEAA